MGKMGLCCTLGIARFDSMPKKNCVKKTDKFRTFWTMAAKNSHYAEGDSKNKENTNEFLGFIVLQRSWLPFVALEINKSFLIPIIVRPTCFLINPFLTMLSRSRWLEIGLFPFSGVFMDLDFV